MLRHRLSWLVSLGLVGVGILDGQSLVDLKTQTKRVDFTSASSTKPVKAGTSLPATCTTNELFFLTSAPPGANLYACPSVNTWSLETGGGSVSSGTSAPTGACFAGAIYTDTGDSTTWFCESPGVWQKALTTTNVGPFLLTGQNGANPLTAPSGSTELFFNSTAKTAQSIDDAGGLGTMVRPADCSGSAQFLQIIRTDGTVACAAPVAAPPAPVTFNFPAGAGSSASPNLGIWWQQGSTTAVCPVGTPFQCFLHWNSGTDTLAVTTSVPHAWTSGTVSVALSYQGDGTGNTLQPAVSSGCVSNTSAGYTFNAVQNFPAQITVSNNYYITALASLTMTGCSADSLLVLQFSRADSAGFLNLTQASITFNLP